MEAIFLLRAKTDGPYWRLTNFGALLVNEDGVARAHPPARPRSRRSTGWFLRRDAPRPGRRTLTWSGNRA